MSTKETVSASDQIAAEQAKLRMERLKMLVREAETGDTISLTNCSKDELAALLFS